MRLAAVLLVAFACSGALASEPGHPLDCAEFVFAQPGYTCETFDWNAKTLGTYTQVDNAGRLFRFVSELDTSNPCGSQFLNRLSLQWMHDGAWETLAFVKWRCLGDGNGYDAMYSAKIDNGDFGQPALIFDATHGRMLITLNDVCYHPGNCPDYPQFEHFWVAAIGGFASTVDILQTYAPATSSLAFRVPYMPEGMAAADHFDTYWGDLTHPLDFTQAHPLACNYPAAAPHVGDYLTVADTVPTPTPGQGVFYVTAATYQGAMRFGRKTTAGHLSGRDPAVLPGCGP